MRILLQTFFFVLLVMQICFAQWYEQESATNQNLYSVQFIDANTGYAVGDSGTIINTSNGGITWQSQITGTNYNLTDVFFVDSNKGWAIGHYYSYPTSEGIVLYTSDAGVNWKTLWSQENVALQSIYFIDSLRGWIVGDTLVTGVTAKSAMWFTTDGGATWTSKYNGEFHTILFSIYFIDSFNGWAVGKSYSSIIDSPILHTTNGGIDWIDLSNNFEIMSAYSTHFSDINNGWIVGEATAYKTIDGGINWIKNDSISGRYQENTSVMINSPNDIWVVGYFVGPAWLTGYIKHTTNSGSSWSKLYFGQDTAFYSCDFTDPQTGWVVGAGGIILHTTNGGVSFVDENQVDEIPIDFLLSQNYPNPFNPCTKLKYSVPQTSQVQIKVFDVLGNEIETLVNEEKTTGAYELTWNAANLPSGVYFYQLNAGEFISTKKMILLK